MNSKSTTDFTAQAQLNVELENTALEFVMGCLGKYIY